MSSNGSKFFGVVATLTLTGMALAFLGGVMGASRGFQNLAMPVVALIGGTAVFIVLIRGPIGQGIAKMLDGRSAPDDQVLSRIEQIEGLVSELGLDQQRMAELEDRLDFAERLLAQRNDAAMLKAPESR